MRRRGALGVTAVALVAVATVVTGVVGGGSQTGHSKAALPSGSIQFEVPAAAVAAGGGHVDPSCYVPTDTHNGGPATAKPVHYAVWRTRSNPVDITVTTPQEATAAQNDRVLFCLHQAGLDPQLRVGNDFRTD